jgi:hypothetical protein
MSAFHPSFTMAGQEKVSKSLPKLIDELVVWSAHDLFLSAKLFKKQKKKSKARELF